MNIGRVLIGLFLIVIGGCLGIDAATAWSFNDIFAYVWPVFLMVWGVSTIFEKRFDLFRVIVFFVGLFFLLNKFYDFDREAIKDSVWACIVIAIGVSLLYKKRSYNGPRDGKIDVSAIFGGKNVSVNDEFLFAECNAIFGGSQLNLYNAKIVGNAYVEANAVFGGVEIIVPRDLKIVVNGTPIFGGIENKALNNDLTNEAPVLTINATAIFGGIEIKN